MNSRRSRSGFSLIELMVVVGVIMLLITFTTGAVIFAQRRAEKTRMRLDLQAIASALDAYALDFKNTYPKAPTDVNGDPINPRGILVWALIAPGAAAADGQDGPGFRTGGAKVWGPYLSPEKFKFDPTTYDLLDRWGSPIEYYPKRHNLNPSGGAPLVQLRSGPPGLYHEVDRVPNRGVPQRTLRFVLGDEDMNNRIDAGETLRHSGPYILASAGSDLRFVDLPSGIPKVEANRRIEGGDDLYNFER